MFGPGILGVLLEALGFSFFAPIRSFPPLKIRSTPPSSGDFDLVIDHRHRDQTLAWAFEEVGSHWFSASTELGHRARSINVNAAYGCPC